MDEIGEEPILQLTGHTKVEHIRDSQVALIDFAANDYSVEAEMQFVTNYLPDPGAGWFGFALRAQDFMNYEIVWFMPGPGEAPQSPTSLWPMASSRGGPKPTTLKRKVRFRFQKTGGSRLGQTSRETASRFSSRRVYFEKKVDVLPREGPSGILRWNGRRTRGSGEW